MYWIAIVSGFGVRAIVGLGGGWRLTDDAFAAAGIQVEPGRGDRHGPVVRRRHQCRGLGVTRVAGIGNAGLGLMNRGLLGTLLIGSIPGIWHGARLTRKMPGRLVRSLLCVGLVIAGLKVIS